MDGISEQTEVMIIDFGGGTCDVAIFTLRRDEDQTVRISPRAVSRYHRLGGADIDRAIVHEVLLPELAAQNGKDLEDWEYEVRKEQLEPQLLATAEQLKVGLCELLNHRMAHGEALEPALADAVKEYPGTQTLSLADGTRLRFASPRLTGTAFEEIMTPFLDRDGVMTKEDEYTLSCSIFAPIEDALDRAKVRPAQIGFLLAVGGSSLNPLVIDALKSRFGEFLVHRFEDALDMQVAVARGAAYHALLLELYGQSVFQPVASDSLSLQTDRGPHEIVARGARLPAEGVFRPTRQHRFIAPGGPIRISFWAGQGIEARPVFTGLTQPVEAGTALTLAYGLDENQHFTFNVTPADGGPAFAGTIESPLHNVVNPGKDRELILEIERNIRSAAYEPSKLPAQLLELAQLHNKVGMHDKAVYLLKRLARQSREYRRAALGLLAVTYGRKGDAVRQEKTYLDAILDGCPVALFNLANFYSRKGRWADAEELCRRYEAEEPCAVGMVLYARCLSAQGKATAAAAALADAFGRFGRDLSKLDENTFSWYQAAVEMSADPALRRACAEEEKRRRQLALNRSTQPEGLPPILSAQEGRERP